MSDKPNPYDLSAVGPAQRRLEHGGIPAPSNWPDLPADSVYEAAYQRCDNLEAENACLKAELAAAQARIAKLERDVKIEQEIVDLFNRCIHDAGKLWHETHPDAEMYPGGSGLIVWLKEQVDALAARRCETCAHAKMEPLGEFYWCRRRTPSLQTDRDHSCPHWQGKEDADA